MLINRAYEHPDTSKGARLVMYILQHTDGNTKVFSRTYKQIQEDTGISYMTIADVFKKLEADGTLIHTSKSEWFVPAVVGYSDKEEPDKDYVESLL